MCPAAVRTTVVAWLVCSILACDQPEKPTRSTLVTAAPSVTGSARALSKPFASAPASAALNDESVAKVVQSKVLELQHECLVPYIDSLPAEDIDFQLMIDVGRNGVVVDGAVIGGKSKATRPVRRCVERALKSWTFEAPASPPQTVTAMISLRPFLD